jgi:hypothetical protein
MQMGTDPHIQPTTFKETHKKERSGEWTYLLSLTVFGAYANVAAYGFQYPAGADYNFFLPMANWFRDPSLYPGDAMRNVFPHVQTFYWPFVAMLSRYCSTEHILFGLLLATKLIFFGAVGRLVAVRVRNRVLGACMVAAIALSGMLNGQTPIGGTIVLDEISEHAALGMAIVLLAGVLLVEGKWRSAAVVAALSVYVDALQFVHALPAFALLAVIYWREEKRKIVSAAFLGAGVSLPWYIHFHRSFLANYPRDYVSVLLIHYPLHITLRWTPISQIVEGAIVLLAMVAMCFVARKCGLKRDRRLELLAVSYFAVLLVGILAGWFWLKPGIARLMLPRADSLLFPYAFLLIQIYGAGLLETREIRRPATTCLLAVLAVLSPLYDILALPLLLAMGLCLEPHELLDRFLAAVFGRFRRFMLAISISRVAVGLCSLAILVSFSLMISPVDQLWNFKIPPDADETACYDAQIWARDHTPREAAFLVPPSGCGFRVLSLRSSWGEWSDGNAMYFDPAFADVFLKRVKTLDPDPVPQGTGIIDTLTEVYRKQSWDRIRAVANENHLDYIVQFKAVKYPGVPVYEDEGFAIYKAR